MASQCHRNKACFFVRETSVKLVVKVSQNGHLGSGPGKHTTVVSREGRNEGKKEVGMMLFLSAPLSIVWREWAQNM